MAKATGVSVSNTLRDRLIANSTLTHIDTLANSAVFNNKDSIKTAVPALNIACSGDIIGGFHSGLTILAGPSKHYKSMLGLRLVSAYLKQYPDGTCIFIDSEHGLTPAYLKANGIDPERVIHAMVEHIEEAKFELVKQLKSITREDKVIVFFDSLGNCASKKELDDAIAESSKADMSRAKAIKGLFRMITPLLHINDVPMIVINHVYEEQGLFAKTIMSGGTGIYLSADTIFFIGRSQEKDGDEVIGYNFKLKVEKSRFVKEKSVIPIQVTWEGGLSPFSGLFDMAKDCGIITVPTKGYVTITDTDTGEIILDKGRVKSITKDHYIKILKMKSFAQYVIDTYKIPEIDMDKQIQEDFEGL